MQNVSDTQTYYVNMEMEYIKGYPVTSRVSNIHTKPVGLILGSQHLSFWLEVNDGSDKIADIVGLDILGPGIPVCTVHIATKYLNRYNISNIGLFYLCFSVTVFCFIIVFSQFNLLYLYRCKTNFYVYSLKFVSSDISYCINVARILL